MLKSFQTGSHYLVFISTYFCIWANFRFLSLRGPIQFLDPSLMYLKLTFPFNKQFSIDTFLDWEDHYLVFAHLFTNIAPHSLIRCNFDNLKKSSRIKIQREQHILYSQGLTEWTILHSTAVNCNEQLIKPIIVSFSGLTFPNLQVLKFKTGEIGSQGINIVMVMMTLKLNMILQVIFK